MDHMEFLFKYHCGIDINDPTNEYKYHQKFDVFRFHFMKDKLKDLFEEKFDFYNQNYSKFIFVLGAGKIGVNMHDH